MSTKTVKELMGKIFEKLSDKHFRVMIFFRLNDEQHFLLNIYDSKEGFLKDFKGLKLFVSRRFREILENHNVYEIHSGFETDYPFLYENFEDDFILHIEKIFLNDNYIGVLEFAYADAEVTDRAKDAIEEFLINAQLDLYEVYNQIVIDIVRRHSCLEALNTIKTIRPRTFYHSFRVAELSYAIGYKLGLEKFFLRRLYYAGLIHDLGELFIPNDILNKTGKLTDEEFEIVKQHPKNLRSIFLDNPFLDDIVEIAFYHHEREDGKGYYGLRGDELSLESKIVAIAEFIDGFHTERPDRKAVGMDTIINLINQAKGTMFNSDIAIAAVDVASRFYNSPENYLDRSPKIGKPATILVDKEGALHLFKGAVEYAAGNILGLSFIEQPPIKLDFKDIVRAQLPIFSAIVDLKAEVITFTDKLVNLKIKYVSKGDVALEVKSSFDVIVIPLKANARALSVEESKKLIKVMKSVIFGSNFLIAKTDSVSFSIGDSVILKARPIGETLTIPAVVSNIIDEQDSVLIRFEYFGLNEAVDAKIHRAIYTMQVKSRL